MSDTLHIIQHSGLGDHLLCNGIIRTYTERYKKLYLNVLPSTADNVRFMYRDLKGIDYYELFYADYQNYINNNPGRDYLILGCTGDYFNRASTRYYSSFDHGFYSMARVPYADRWNKFHLERDMDKEKEAFYDKLGLSDKDEYIFLHEDPTRSRLLRDDLYPSHYKIIRSHDHKDVGVFDFIYTIERAKEIHVMDSCFLALIDNMQIEHDRLYLHNYGINAVVYPTAVKMQWHLFIDRNTRQNELYYNNNNIPTV